MCYSSLSGHHKSKHIDQLMPYREKQNLLQAFFYLTTQTTARVFFSWVKNI